MKCTIFEVKRPNSWTHVFLLHWRVYTVYYRTMNFVVIGLLIGEKAR